ncbi:DNA topoisomerase 3-alpha [Trifolium repens]|nr:DNA topoisomerase 3-alpha [Trifolium repens]
MMCSDDFSLKPVLVLQVVLSFHNYIYLSDGKNVVSALVPLNLVDESRCYEVDILSSGFKDELVHSTMPQVATIVKLTNYTLKEFQRHKFFIIIHFDVVLENHVIIGRPVQLPTNPSWTYHPIEHFYLTCPPVKLTQGAIDNILSGNFSSDKGFKPVLQVFCLRNNIIFLSDGCYRFYLICNGDLRGRFKNRSRFSVIKLTDYYLLENSKNHKVVVVRDLEVILSNMWQIGKPVPLPEEAPSCVCTAKAAQYLYTKEFISYPRIETDMFSIDINLRVIVEEQKLHPKCGAYAHHLLDLKYFLWRDPPRELSNYLEGEEIIPELLIKTKGENSNHYLTEEELLTRMKVVRKLNLQESLNIIMCM